MRAGIYTRISKDLEGSELGVKRQEDDCRREAERRGWSVVQTYTDNDVSATRSKTRPAYERMLQDIRSGYLEAIVVWAVDRLTRTPRELEDVIDLADRYGLVFANVGGTIDLGTPEGRAMARQMGTFARLEVENQARRLRRKFQEKAEKGEPHGYPPYGYERVDGRDIPRPAEAAIIKECARRALMSESLRSIAADLNRRGVHGPKSPQWNTTIIRQILMRPSNAGLRQHRGRIIGKATTIPILTEETHAQLVAMFTDPSRRSNNDGPTPKYLLAGIAICGRCGGRMRRSVGRLATNPRTGATKRQPPAYQCQECFRVRRRQDLVEEVVERAIIGRLSRADAADLFQQGDSEVVAECRELLAGLDAKLDVAAAQFADDVITAEQLKRITAQVRERREQTVRRLEAAQPKTVFADLAGPRAGDRWEKLTLGAKREVIEMLLSVTVLPSGPGQRFQPSQIQIAWKT
ncbi:recombinase family protein [Microbacterium laevaniformans]|uniref:recombinase family protein n=1 Tax=Microbacterium laevaniformans TaxID=36807 RepID=UPI003632F3D1